MREAIDLIISRDEKGLSLLYDNYAPALLGIIVRIVKNKNIGEEVLQSTYLKVWNSIQLYDPNKGQLFTWLAAIARRMAIDKVRLKGYQRQLDNVYLDDSSSKMGTTNTHIESLDTDKLLASLMRDQRMILDMIYLQGYSHRQTAEILGLTLGTVKSRLRTAIKTLRDSLEGEKKLFLSSSYCSSLYQLLHKD